MNILTATDDNYAPWCGVMLSSLFKHNNEEDIHVYILADNVSDDNKEKFKKLHPGITIIDLEDASLKSWVPSLELGEYLSRTTWARLALSDVLPSNVHKILHIDADTIILGSLRELYETDLTGMAAATVDEYRDARYIGIDGLYFNAGVILFNVDYFRENRIKDKCIEFVKDNASIIKFHDQDVLNKVLEGKVLFKHRKFNLTCHRQVISDDLRINADFKEDKEAVYNGDVRIYHFVGKSKPWISYRFDPTAFDYCWRKIYRDSLWKNTPLIQSVSSLRAKLTVIIVNLLLRLHIKPSEDTPQWVRSYPENWRNKLKAFFSLDSYR